MFSADKFVCVDKTVIPNREMKHTDTDEIHVQNKNLLYSTELFAKHFFYFMHNQKMYVYDTEKW
jgi:hypothetical protein